MVLIDSSVWIEFFRTKTTTIGDNVEDLLDANEATGEASDWIYADIITTITHGLE